MGNVDDKVINKYEKNIQWDIEQMEECSNEGICQECGLELDAHDHNCDCGCHELV